MINVLEMDRWNAVQEDLRCLRVEIYTLHRELSEANECNAKLVAALKEILRKKKMDAVAAVSMQAIARDALDACQI